MDSSDALPRQSKINSATFRRERQKTQADERV